MKSYAGPNIVKQVRALQHNNLELESALYRWMTNTFLYVLQLRQQSIQFFKAFFPDTPTFT